MRQLVNGARRYFLIWRGKLSEGEELEEIEAPSWRPVPEISGSHGPDLIKGDEESLEVCGLVNR